MSVDRRYFESLMGDRRMSLRALASRMGLSHSQLSLTFSGSRRMQLDEAVRLSQIFGVSLPEVASHAGIEGAERAGRRVNVIGVLRGNGTVERYSTGDMERTICPDGMPSEVQAIQARTADTQLAWMDGWVFFFNLDEQMQAGAIGRYCLAQVTGGPMVISTLRRGYENGAFALSGPYPSENARLDWATPILITRH